MMTASGVLTTPLSALEMSRQASSQAEAKNTVNVLHLLL